MKIHILNCGYIRIHKDLLYGGGNIMTDFRKAVMAPDSRRVTLPVFAYLVEHPAGLFLVDTASDPACIAALCSHDKETKPETIEF